MKPIEDQQKPLTGPNTEAEKKPCCKLVAVVSSSPSKQGNGSDKTAAAKPVQNVQKNATKKSGHVYHHGFKSTDMAQKYIQHAYLISNWDRDYILLLNAENGDWNTQLQSKGLLSNGQREKSRWLCQVHYYDHPEVYDNLPLDRIMESRFLTDWKYQIEVCYKLYKEWVPFFAFDHRYQRAGWRIEIDGKRY